MDKPRLLIVEDESVVVVDLDSRLAHMGYEVVGSAASGEECLALAGQFLPDLILMDIRLQGAMDGVETAQKIRDLLGLPVVFITAHAEGDTLMRAKKVEPYGYILKPFEDRELKIVIEMALYKRQTENELKQKYEQIARFDRVAVGRELRMIELKREVNALRRAAGLADKYRIVDEA
jgi:DNA-binding NtrC family response regulator